MIEKNRELREDWIKERLRDFYEYRREEWIMRHILSREGILLWPASRRGLGLLCPRCSPGSPQAWCSCRRGPYGPGSPNSNCSGSSSQLQPSVPTLPHANQGEEEKEVLQPWGRLRRCPAGRGGTDPSLFSTGAALTGTSAAAD